MTQILTHQMLVDAANQLKTQLVAQLDRYQPTFSNVRIDEATDTIRKYLPEMPDAITTLYISLNYHGLSSAVAISPSGRIYWRNPSCAKVYGCGNVVDGWVFNLTYNASEAKSKQRTTERTAKFKEELMTITWHPDRVAKIIAVGGTDALD